jgi:hypothetical protein
MHGKWTVKVVGVLPQDTNQRLHARRRSFLAAIMHNLTNIVPIL